VVTHNVDATGDGHQPTPSSIGRHKIFAQIALVSPLLHRMGLFFWKNLGWLGFGPTTEIENEKKE